MKFLLLALFAAVAFATPIPMEDPSRDAVEVVVNGLAEGEPLEIGHLVDVKVKEIADGEVAAVSNALHPFTAQGLAEAAAAAEVEEAANAPQPVVPDLDVIPEVNPGLIVPELPAPGVIPEPIVIPDTSAPEVDPEPVVLPEPGTPEVVPSPIEPTLPEVPAPAGEVPEAAASSPNGEIFNNGIVSVTVNTPEDAGVVATLSSWVSMMVNYVHSGIAYTQQLI